MKSSGKTLHISQYIGAGGSWAANGLVIPNDIQISRVAFVGSLVISNSATTGGYFNVCWLSRSSGYPVFGTSGYSCFDTPLIALAEIYLAMYTANPNTRLDFHKEFIIDPPTTVEASSTLYFGAYPGSNTTFSGECLASYVQGTSKTQSRL